MDLSKLKLDHSPKARETDPLKIFGALTQRGQVETLYGPQQEALTKWHKDLRGKSDVLISMATGGGKTLVGLLAAQSLVNELRAKVVYVCATNQLVEQTASQAQDCGIQVATYMKGAWTNRQKYDTAEYACLTNYHALFNGLSRFRNDSVRAVLFDDAHVAPGIIRDCFTLKIQGRDKAWGPLMGIFHDYFRESPFATRFDRLRNPAGGYTEGVLFVPAWFIWERRDQIGRALSGNGIDDDQSVTQFPYAHLRDHLPHCGYFVSFGRIEITPTLIPTHQLSYFQGNVRRIYLTATLPSRYECIRTFGVDRAEVVSPSGKMGAAQRLFAFPQGSEEETAFDQTRTLIEEHKACIIVPSGETAKRWVDIGSIYDSERGHAAISEFARANDTRKIILAGLFDGIDLPGHACKVLVLDGVPRGAGLHDRFLEEHLDAKQLKVVQIAGRLTQAIGRIFRSNTDHGIVVIAHKGLQSWLRDNSHLSYLPLLLQQQIQLGDKLRSAIDEHGKEAEYPRLMEQVIQGEAEWDKWYNQQMSQIESQKRPKEPAWGDSTAQKEYAAWRDAWEGRYEDAAKKLTALAGELATVDRALAAWQLHWAGLQFLQIGDHLSAQGSFVQSANTKMILGRPGNELFSGERKATFKSTSPSPQAIRAVPAFGADFGNRITEVREMLAGDGGKNADDHESALAVLGELLGLETERPDHEYGIGPDVTWHHPEAGIVVGMEAKTQKESPSSYKKNKHIGKVHNDCKWLHEQYGDVTVEPWIVGPVRPVASQASPPDSLRIIPMESIIELADRVHQAGLRVASRPSGTPLEVAIQEAFERFGLTWLDLRDGIEYRLAIDLQQADDFEARDEADDGDEIVSSDA